MTQDWNHLSKNISKRLAPSMAKDHPNLPVVKEDGCYYWGVDGRKYLDFTSGIAVTNVGHRHPRIVEAIKNAADELTHGPIGVIQYESILRLAEELAEIMPGEIDCFFFGNSGTEAIEGALKLARYVTKRPYMISFTGCFHGRTMGSLGVSTSKSKYRKHLQTDGNTYQIPYYRPEKFEDEDGTIRENEAIEKLEEDFAALFNHQVSPDEVAGVIVEPVLGEGGYVMPPASWLKSIRKICDRHGMLLIFDEVQTGFGRTGNWFAAQTFGVTPDIMAVAKGIASGLPLSATAASHKLMQQWPMGSHATTFGGNPIACSAALATIEIIKDESLLENTVNAGAHAVKEIEKLKQRHSVINNVRSLGLMIGIEIVSPSTGKPDGEAVLRILDLALDEGVLFYLCGNEGEVIRMIPPLTVTTEQIDEGLRALDRALTRFEKERTTT
ncbi:aspartate aminotransferase family protein [Bacillus sp. H-16]|uniref:aspartate aminotransferase family protein n=1 Tax=Alteribacter salitolerans TaxID=2912333 RepID=UPI001964D0A6|nr:aspartate aminotransferase family protein [Alteribacter salitolerans]MBM7095752.1 aspartate aminotransferase family protein [Alteribacter salitolerans]